MTEVDASAPPRDAAGFVLNLLPAAAVGAVFVSLLSLPLGRGSNVYVGSAGGFQVADVVPALIVLVAAGLAVVPALYRFGWLVAVPGLLVTVGLYLQGQYLGEVPLYLVLAAALGLQLAGFLLAFGAASTAGRWGVVLGTGFGLGLGGRFGLEKLVEWFLGSDSFRGRADELAIGALAVVTLGAGLRLTRLPGAAPAPSTVRGPLIMIVAAVVVARGLGAGWQAVLDAMTQSSTGGISQERASDLESLNEAARIGIAAAVAIILMVAAYRRGGSGLARWVVAAFACAAFSLGGPPLLDITQAALVVILASAVGALLAGLAVTRADRLVPWDALGALVMAAGVLVASPWGRQELPGLRTIAVVAAVGGLAFVLTAGLARLVGPGRGLDAGGVGLSAAYGFAALLLGQQLLNGAAQVVARRGPDSLALDVVVTMAAAAVVLVVLFGLGRTRGRGLVEEAPAGRPDVPAARAAPESEIEVAGAEG